LTWSDATNATAADGVIAQHAIDINRPLAGQSATRASVNVAKCPRDTRGIIVADGLACDPTCVADIGGAKGGRRCRAGTCAGARSGVGLNPEKARLGRPTGYTGVGVNAGPCLVAALRTTDQVGCLTRGSATGFAQADRRSAIIIFGAGPGRDLGHTRTGIAGEAAGAVRAGAAAGKACQS
jgi:hypothetical protein